jgi:O-antigen/teichoic acid export membrane protein
MKHGIRRFLSAKSGIMAVLQTAFANLAVQGVNFFCGILTARSLGPDGRGLLAGIIMWPQFLAYGMTIGIPIASVYWLKRRPDLSSELAGAGLLLSVVFGLLAALVGIVVIPYSLHTYPAAAIHLAQLWVLVTPLELLAVTFIAQAQAADAFSNYNIFRFLSPFSVLVILAIEKWLSRITYSTAAFAYLLGGIPSMIWIAHWAWQYFRPTLRSAIASSRLLLSYGIRAWGVDLLSTVASQVDRVLVVGLLSPEFMGLYVIAQSAAGVLAFIPTAVAPITMPRSTTLGTDDILALTGRAARATLCLMLLASLPLLFFGGFLLSLVYGSTFTGASAVLPFLVVEAIASGLTSVLAQAFLATGFPGTVSMLQGCGLLTSIPLMYWLIPRFGLPGAGCALMLSTLGRLLLILFNFPYKLKSRPPGLIMRRAEFIGLFATAWQRVTTE